MRPVAVREGTVSRRTGYARKVWRFVRTRRNRERTKAEIMAKSPAFQSLSGSRATLTAVRRLRKSAAISPAAARTPKVGRKTLPKWRI
jgi:hypothetical protein